MQIQTKEEAIKVITDHYGMNKDMLNNTIGNGSTSFSDYTTTQLIYFAKYQIDLCYGLDNDACTLYGL